NRPARSRTARRLNARTDLTRSEPRLVNICWPGICGPQLWDVEAARDLVGGESGGGVGGGLCRRVRPRDLNEGGEGGGVVDGQLGQHAPVNLDLGSLQTLDETVVGHAVG